MEAAKHPLFLTASEQEPERERERQRQRERENWKSRGFVLFNSYNLVKGCGVR